MQNVEMTTNGNVLTITVDLSKRLGRSASGKTLLIATTGGNVSAPNDEAIKVGLNIYTK